MGRLIDADALIKALNLAEWFNLADFNEAVYTVRKAQPVDAVPVVHGHWKEDPSGYDFWICSACGFVSEASAANVLYKFCPHCGARNIEGDDES